MVVVRWLLGRIIGDCLIVECHGMREFYYSRSNVILYLKLRINFIKSLRYIFRNAFGVGVGVGVGPNPNHNPNPNPNPNPKN